MTATPTSPRGLEAFQRRFAAALLADDPGTLDAGALGALVAQPGFAVYRNTVASGCVDALRAGYPTVRALVGDEAFSVAALAFSRAHPPRVPMLLEYGDGFAAFLAAFPPAAEMPWLADVARADRFRTEAHVAADESPVDARCVARLGAERIGQARLRPHTSSRWAWFEHAPVASIWRAHHDERHAPVDDDFAVDTAVAEAPGPDSTEPGAPGPDLSGIAWQAEGLLVVRPRDAVTSVGIDRAACAFLDACAAGETIAHAALAALAADEAADLSRLMSTLLCAGAFGALDIPAGEEDLP